MEPKNVLDFEIRNEDYHIICPSPFVENPQISLFEFHLKTGYNPLWEEIEKWKEAHQRLADQTEKLAEKTRLYIKQLNLLPEYRPTVTGEYINYTQFPKKYFDSVLYELKFKTEFKVDVSQFMQGETKWFQLSIDSTLAQSPNKEKIFELKGKIEEFHSNPLIFKEFKDIFDQSEELNAQLKEIFHEVENVWTKVENDVPLQGWCEAGVEGMYEKNS